MKERIRAFIKRVNEEKDTTVILTTHDLGDIEELCKRVLIIDDGVLIYDCLLYTSAARRPRANETARTSPVPAERCRCRTD